ncbi:hypothetical protein RintRC_6804 [Richelia intracellularis]|nr:hypothetical protein RintRC_6804 [Richelia intracellularis]
MLTVDEQPHATDSRKGVRERMNVDNFLAEKCHLNQYVHYHICKKLGLGWRVVQD